MKVILYESGSGRLIHTRLQPGGHGVSLNALRALAFGARESVETVERISRARVTSKRNVEQTAEKVDDT